MKKVLVVAVIAASLLSLEAKAQERAGSAALGAVSGAVVLGPLGAVAGALIGYTAGPAIAHSLGARHSASRASERHALHVSTVSHEAAASATPLQTRRAAEIAATIPPPVQCFE